MKTFSTLDSVLQALADGRHVRSTDVTSRVLRARVWVAGVGLPGCLYDSGPDYFRSKADALAHLVFIADDGEDGPRRGLRADLARYGSAGQGSCVYEMSRTTVGSIL